MKRVMTGTIAALALAGCGGGNDVSLKNASVEEVAKAAASSATQMKPGQWETVAEVVSMDFPGMPKSEMTDQVAAQMKGKPMTILHCVTPEQAQKPAPSMFSGKSDGSCTFDKYEVSGGRIAAAVSCTAPNGDKVHQAISGSFGAEASNVEVEVTSEGAMGKVHQKLKSRSRRVGECPPA